MAHHTADVTPRLDAYHFYEEEWDGYDQLREAFEWEVPDQFNTATYVCDRWADRDGSRDAMYAEAADGTAQTHTYADLQSIANRLANYLAEQGVGRGDRVAVNGTQKVENLATHVAIWKLGAVSVPLSILLGPEGLAYRLANSGAVAYVADAENVAALREVRDDLDDLDSVVLVGDDSARADEVPFWDAVEDREPTFETAATDPDDDAFIIYTSGTTGDPKGVILPHRSLLGGLPGVVLGMFNLTVDDADVSRTPVEWSWIGSLHLGILPALYYGIPIVAHADNEFDAEREYRLVEAYDVTLTGGPATALRMMTQVPDRDDYDTSTVRVVVQGGEALGRALVDDVTDAFPNATVQEVYGQSEALLFVADCAALGVGHLFGKMGRPVPGHEVRVQDPETGEPRDTGEVGEIALRYDDDPMPFKEYWGLPEKTAEKVQDGWLRSEDLGVAHEDGYLSFHSRADDVIISSGYKMGPGEIEDALAEHPAVADAGVIGVPDDTRGEIAKAFVALAPGTEPSDALAEELKEHVKDSLAKYEYPRALEFVDELPRTTTGKVRRYDLRQREGVVD
ncbi:MAG: acyl-CoA synthetase [Haloarculaceae archaeon]